MFEITITGTLYPPPNALNQHQLAEYLISSPDLFHDFQRAFQPPYVLKFKGEGGTDLSPETVERLLTAQRASTLDILEMGSAYVILAPAGLAVHSFRDPRGVVIKQQGVCLIFQSVVGGFHDYTLRFVVEGSKPPCIVDLMRLDLPSLGVVPK